MATTKYDLAHDCLVEMQAKVEALLGKQVAEAIYEAASAELAWNERVLPSVELPVVYALDEVAL